MQSNVQKENGEILNEVGMLSNVRYQTYVTLCDTVNEEMSMFTGWRGQHRPINLDGFGGYHMAVSDNAVMFMSGDEVLGSIRPCKGGGIVTDGFTAEVFGGMDPQSPDYSLLRDICTSPSNLNSIYDDFHRGYEVIYGLTVDGTNVFGVDPRDANVRPSILEMYEEAVFLSPNSLRSLYDGYVTRSMTPGPVPELPRLHMLFYDGVGVYTSEVMQKRRGLDYEVNGSLMRQLSEGLDRISSELMSKAGTPDGVRYVFPNAMCQVDLLRDDILCVGRRFSTESPDFVYIGVFDRKVHIMDESSSDVRIFQSPDDALALFRKSILSQKNIASAKYDMSCMLDASKGKKKGI